MQLIILISRSTLTKMLTGTIIAENVREKKDKGRQHNLGQNATTNQKTQESNPVSLGKLNA
jgi:co-chaperonin GroES (HSP10)